MANTNQKVDTANEQITTLENEIIADADANLLSMIDFDRLLENPEQELSQVAGAFLLKHENKIKQGAKIGADLAQDLLK